MNKKPYEVILKNVEESDKITPKNKEHLIDFLKHEHPGNVLFTKWNNPPVIAKGQGNKVWDADGKEYIDCLTGMSCMSLGHGDPRILKTMIEQYGELCHFFDFPTPERLRLVKRLKELTPGEFDKRVLLLLNGSDAVEAAIKAARYKTKKTHIISFYGAYHGQSTAVIGFTGAGSMHQYYNPVPSADHCIERFPFAYCYRCAYDKKPETCNMYCAKVIDDLLSTSQTSMGNPSTGINNVAAMIVEPMQSSAGYIMPPKEFLVKLRELADKYGFYLIFDEIQTGMGRTGKMWGCDHSDVAPDILLTAKALGNGLPISAVIGRADIFDEFAPGSAVNAYAGYAMGCAVANKVLDIFEEDDIVKNCAQVGEYLGKVVKSYKEKHPMVGTYSQTGVYLGIEYVKDHKTKEPAKAETRALIEKMREAGILAQLNGYLSNRISFIPPLNITTEDVDEIFEIMDRLTTEVEEEYNISIGIS